MNDADKCKVKKLIDGNPEFRKLYSQLFAMRGRIQPVNIAPLRAHELAEGKAARIWYASRGNPTPVIREIEHLAAMLARFFPDGRRARWQEIFISVALGGTGELKQRPGGNKISSDVYPYFQRWANSGFDRKAKAQLLKEYSDSHEDTEAVERFNREMRRYKQKQRADKIAT